MGIYNVKESWKEFLKEFSRDMLILILGSLILISLFLIAIALIVKYKLLENIL
jgi:hypothetical protein